MHEPAEPLVADGHLKSEGIGLLTLTRDEIHEIPLERWRRIKPLDAEREAVAIHRHPFKIRSQSEIPHW